MLEVIRLGDPSNHGGHMITATGIFIVDGIEVCVNGDLHSCPVIGHGVTAVTASHPQMDGNSKAVIVVGDTAGCGAALSSGSPDTTAY